MAVMQNCCCCGVRAGSIASAIYSMQTTWKYGVLPTDWQVIAILGCAYFGYTVMGIATFKEYLYEVKLEFPEEYADLDIDSFVSAVTAEYVFACISQGLILIASILCIIGINMDNKGLLVPFMAAKSLGIVWYLFALACSGYMMAKIGIEVAGAVVIVLMVLLIPFFISDIVCLLCVLSQYQEYRDGRGRLVDQRGTTVIVQNTMPAAAGGFAYGQIQHAPPAYASPNVIVQSTMPAGAGGLAYGQIQNVPQAYASPTVVVQNTMPAGAGGLAYGQVQHAPQAYASPVVTKVI